MASTALDWVHPISSHIETLLVFSADEVKHVLNKDDMDALLDGESGLAGIRGKQRAVFVQANHDWLIQALVCCVIPFDEEGYCEPDWPLPLQRLCDTAGPGPDFGAGRIRLACRSQCPISGYKENLWDPSTAVFAAINTALDDAQGELVHQPSPQDPAEEVSQIKRTLRNEEAAYRNQIQQLQQELEKQTLLTERATQQLAELSQKRSSLAEHELRRENESLNMKIREQQVTIEKLRGQTQASHHDADHSDLNDSDLVQRMQEHEVMSVVFHPGAGHLNLQAHQLLDYLDDPIAYAAHHISLSKAEYLVWLKHHDHPQCVVCDAQVALIGNPKIFDSQRDIYCDEHKPLESHS
ncbi:hypothetical protein QNI23_009860 [Bermanella sp. WJH001]|uniref:hypothetical protein n=1 Tax=Bermanella sp. WJH001 TaxID=3048005 RepID=UPI0024BDDA2E|nr:hypothetical protein [Bermanella sp. WJH001]MDJ1537301.1 hypothetical protein [Bermanella sp. WJH001]